MQPLDDAAACAAAEWDEFEAFGRGCYNLSAIAEACHEPELSWFVVGKGHPATDVISWCETCVRNDGTVDPLTRGTLNSANVSIMSSLDKIALLFATFIVASTAVGELKDIALCSLAIGHAGETLSLGWRIALTLLGGIR